MFDKTRLDVGDRVWVFEPFLFGPKLKAGKIIGKAIKFPVLMELEGLEADPVDYLVDFGSDGLLSVASAQVKSYLRLVA